MRRLPHPADIRSPRFQPIRLFRFFLACLFSVLWPLGPALPAWAQDRSFLGPSRPRHDEFGASREDSSHFSPRRLRERMEKMDRFVAAQRARLAGLSSWAAPAAPSGFSTGLEASMEKFLAAQDMAGEVERKRLEGSRHLARAAGFQFRTYTDGRRVWYKAGRVHRVENEKHVDASGKAAVRDTLDMAYDAKGNLLSYRTETRDSQGRLTFTQWSGTYEAGPDGKSRLIGFSETSWDALGNRTRTDRTNMAYGGKDGREVSAYRETTTDPDGRVSARDVADARYDEQGRVVFFKETATDARGRISSRTWEGRYQRSESSEARNLLENYREETTDASGRTSAREWGDAEYDKKGRLTGFREKTTTQHKDGRTETVQRRWDGAAYDDHGNLVRYQEAVADQDGLKHRVEWRNGVYDEHGRVVGYEETISDPAGRRSVRVWSGAEYNAKHRLLSYEENVVDADGRQTRRDWRALEYRDNHVARFEENTTDADGRVTRRAWNGRHDSQGRLTASLETLFFADGTTFQREQTGLAYDDHDRLLAYQETTVDADRRHVSKTWKAEGFDSQGRVTADLTTTTDRASATQTRRQAIRYYTREDQQKDPARREGDISQYMETTVSGSPHAPLSDKDQPDQKAETVLVTGLGYSATGTLLDPGRRLQIQGSDAGRLAPGLLEKGLARLKDLAADSEDAAERLAAWVRDHLPGADPEKISLSGRAAIVTDPLGRAVSWTDVVVKGNKRQETHVAVTYRGDGQDVDTHASFTRDGERVSHVFKSGFVYDGRGQALKYQEAAFDGETLRLDGQETDWEKLSAAEKQSTLADIRHGKREVEGLVTFQDYEQLHYDARGALVHALGRRLNRGHVLSEFSDLEVFSDTLTQAKAGAAAGIQDETDRTLAAERTILDAAEQETAAVERQIRSAQDHLAAAERDLAQAQAEQEAAQRVLSAEQGAVGDLTRRINDFREKEIWRDTARPAGLRLAGEDTELAEMARRAEREATQWAADLAAPYAGASGQAGFPKVKSQSSVVEDVLSMDRDGNLAYRREAVVSLDLETWDPRRGPVVTTQTHRKILSSLQRTIVSAQDSDDLAAQRLSDFRFFRNGSRGQKAVKDPLVHLYRERFAAKGRASQAELNFQGQAGVGATRQDVVAGFHRDISDLKKTFAAAQSRRQEAGAVYDKKALEIKDRGAALMATAHAEVEAEFRAVAERLAEEILVMDGGSGRLTQEQAMALLDGQAADVLGVRRNLADLRAAARVKTSLDSEESFARLSLDTPERSASLVWRGDLRLNGRTVDPGDSSAISALRAALDSNQGLPGQLSLSGDGHASFSRTTAQAMDELGRLTSQTSETTELSRQGSEHFQKTYTQQTSGYAYNAQGQTIRYARTTREALAAEPASVSSRAPPQEKVTTELLLSAAYDSQGRLASSQTRVTEKTPDTENKYLLTRQDLRYDSAGRLSGATDIRREGNHVTVERLLANRYDGRDRLAFSHVIRAASTAGEWEARGEALLRGPDAAEILTWNKAFDVRGRATEMARATRQTAFAGSRPVGSLLKWEDLSQTYDDRNQTSVSRSRVREWGRAEVGEASQFLRKAYEITTETALSVSGLVLRQKSTAVENGLITVTDTLADNLYDGQGRLIQTHTRTVGPAGEAVDTLWKATALDTAGRVLRFERTTREGVLTTTEISVDDAVYDASGRLRRQTTRVRKSDPEGRFEEHELTSEPLEHDAFGRLLSSRNTTRRQSPEGSETTAVESSAYAYDVYGRVIKTETTGRETVRAGQEERTRAYRQVNEVLAFDEYGRARRARTLSSADGAPSQERISRADIRYDAQGRVLESEDMVREFGTAADGSVLDKRTTQRLSDAAYDAWGRRTAYTLTTLDNALQSTQKVSGVRYDAAGRITDMATGLIETSTDPAIPFERRSAIAQSGMVYDGWGNLVDYAKTVTEGDLVTRFRPVLVEYDKQHRAVTWLERSTDNRGRDKIQGSLGMEYNSLGQLVGGRTVEAEGRADVLDQESMAVRLKKRLLAGDMETEGAAGRVVKDLGLDRVSSRKTLEPNRYDVQGRLVHSRTTVDEAGVNRDRKTLTFECKTLEEARAKIKELGKGFDVRQDVHTATLKYRILNRLRSKDVVTGVTVTAVQKEVDEKHTENALDIHTFDSLNRALAQTLISRAGTAITQEHQRLGYDPAGRIARIDKFVTEKNFHSDVRTKISLNRTTGMSIVQSITGKATGRSYSQTQTFAYDAEGRVVQESVRTWRDTQAPLKDVTVTLTGIRYDARGQRLGWTETSREAGQSHADIREIADVSYDSLGRMLMSNQTVFREQDGNRQWLYTDKNAVNSYDRLGRLAATVADRTWGEAGGGGLQGLDDAWKNGSVKVVTGYSYHGGSGLMSGMTVLADGAGSHAKGDVQAQGIHLRYEQKNIQYDASGRVTRFQQSVTQIESYQWSRVEKGKFGRRKQKSGTFCGAVTTESTVEVLAYDGHGRQTHTVTTSQRHDHNHTWSRTETRVLAFDGSGRAAETLTTSETRQNLGYKTNAASGATVRETVAYNEFGQRDETRTVSARSDEWQRVSRSGASVLDNVMKGMSVIGTMMTFICPFVGLVISGVVAAYNVLRMGISLHDLGVGGRDREGAKQRAMNFWSNVANVAMSWLGTQFGQAGSVVKGAKDTAEVGRMAVLLSKLGSTTNLAVTFATVNATVQAAVSAASGADLRTTLQVAGLAALSGLMEAFILNGGEKRGVNRSSAVAAGLGETMIQFGGSEGNDKSRQRNILIGSALKGGAGKDGFGIGAAAQTTSQRLVLNELERLAGGQSSLSENDALRRNLLMAQGAGLAGAAMNFGIQFQAIMSDLRMTPEERRAAINRPDDHAVNLGKDFLEGLAYPVRAVIGLASAATTGLRVTVLKVRDLWEAKVHGVETVSSHVLPDRTEIQGHRIRLNADGTVQSLPAGTVRTLDGAHGPVVIEGRLYQRGTFVWDGGAWKQAGPALALRETYGGTRRADGGLLPLWVEGEDGQNVAGIAWEQMEGVVVNIFQAAEIPNVATLHSGSFQIIDDLPKPLPGSLYHVHGESFARFVMDLEREYPAEIHGDRFKLMLDRLTMGDGQILRISGGSLEGQIQDGRAMLTKNEAAIHTSLQGRFGLAYGRGTVRISDHGLFVWGALSGDVAWKAPRQDAGADMAGHSAMSDSRQLAPGRYRVLDQKEGYYHLRGDVAFSEAGVQPFTEATQFFLRPGVVYPAFNERLASVSMTEPFHVRNAEIRLPPGGTAYLPNRTIRLGLEPVSVIHGAGDSAYAAQQDYQVAEALLRPLSDGSYTAEIWAGDFLVDMLPVRRQAGRLVVPTSTGREYAVAENPTSRMAGTVAARSRAAMVRDIVEAQSLKLTGRLGRLGAFLGKEYLDDRGPIGGALQALSMCMPLPVPASILGLARSATPPVSRRQAQQQLGRWAERLDGTIERGLFRMSAHRIGLRDATRMGVGGQFGLRVLDSGLQSTLGAFSDVLGQHRLFSYRQARKAGTKELLGFMKDDAKSAGRNAAVGGGLAALAAMTGGSSLLAFGVAGGGMAGFSVLQSDAENIPGKVADGLGAMVAMGVTVGAGRAAAKAWGAKGTIGGWPEGRASLLIQNGRVAKAGILQQLKVRALEAAKQGAVGAADGSLGGLGLIDQAFIANRVHAEGPAWELLGPAAGQKGLDFIKQHGGRYYFEITKNTDGARIPTLDEIAAVEKLSAQKGQDVTFIVRDASVVANLDLRHMGHRLSRQTLEDFDVSVRIERKNQNRLEKEKIQEKRLSGREAARNNSMIRETEKALKKWQGQHAELVDIQRELSEGGNARDALAKTEKLLQKKIDIKGRGLVSDAGGPVGGRTALEGQHGRARIYNTIKQGIGEILRWFNLRAQRTRQAVGGKGKGGGEAPEGLSSLEERLRSYREAGSLEREAGSLEREAGRYLAREIRELEDKMEGAGQDRARFQRARDEALGRAEEARRGIGEARERGEELLEKGRFLDDLIRRKRVSERKAPGNRGTEITILWDKGKLNALNLVDEMMGRQPSWPEPSPGPFDRVWLRTRSLVADKRGISNLPEVVSGLREFFLGKVLRKTGAAEADAAAYSRAAEAPSLVQGYTKAGWALHQRIDGHLQMSPHETNVLAQKMVSDLLSRSDLSVSKRPHKHLESFVELTTPDGRGLQFSSKGEFLDFLDSPAGRPEIISNVRDAITSQRGAVLVDSLPGSPEAKPGSLKHPDITASRHPSPGPLKGNLGQFDVLLLRNAQASGQSGLSVAGQALTEVTRSPETVFPKVTGPPERVNLVARGVVNEILTDPGTTILRKTDPTHGALLEIVSPSGRGLHYKPNGDFVRFVDATAKLPGDEHVPLTGKDGHAAKTPQTEIKTLKDLELSALTARPNRISFEAAQSVLLNYGFPLKRAQAFLASFESDLSIRLAEPGEKFYRYTDNPDGAGSFLTKHVFQSPEKAVKGLYLGPFGNKATLRQEVVARHSTVIIEGAIKGGDRSLQQALVVDRNAFSYEKGTTY